MWRIAGEPLGIKPLNTAEQAQLAEEYCENEGEYCIIDAHGRTVATGFAMNYHFVINWAFRLEMKKGRYHFLIPALML